MNKIGRSFFLLQGSNLTRQQRFDILMRCDGSLSDTNKIRNLMIRMCGSRNEAQSSTRLRMSANTYYDSSSSDCFWQDDTWDSWSWYSGHDNYYEYGEDCDYDYDDYSFTDKHLPR